MSARLVLCGLAVGCALCLQPARPAAGPVSVEGLWEEPADLEERDLFGGPGGRELAPDPSATYAFEDVDDQGFSPGYDVRDAAGREWSVKQGPEAQTEVVVSRLLWAIGYHQPATYYVPGWSLSGKDGVTSQPPGRFRLDALEKVDEWSWRANPFAGSRALQGLFVFMVIVNNWDLKTSQNAVYRVDANGDEPRLLYVVRDLGASLGKTNWLLPGTRNALDDFEREPFIRDVQGNRVAFHYQGAWAEPHLASSVSPGDVRWVSGLLARLTPRQWRDAFRAGGYSEGDATRYITRLREKIAEGQNIR